MLRTIVRGLSVSRYCFATDIDICVVNISQNLGQNIRARRKELSLSQEELARRCNIDRSYMGKLNEATRTRLWLSLTQLPLPSP